MSLSCFVVQKIMTEENEMNFNVAEASTKPANDGDLESLRLLSISSSYEDEKDETEKQRLKAVVGVKETQLNGNSKERIDGQNQLSEDDVTGTEQLSRPIRLSLSNEQPTKPSNDSSSHMNSRHVSFIPEEEAKENGMNDTSVAYDNRGFTDMQTSSDSATRLLVHTNGSVHYQTHSEGEECNESEISIAWTVQHNSQNGPLRRRRQNTHHGTLVSDSFVNECICCCVIL